MTKLRAKDVTIGSLFIDIYTYNLPPLFGIVIKKNKAKIFILWNTWQIQEYNNFKDFYIDFSTAKMKFVLV